MADVEGQALQRLQNLGGGQGQIQAKLRLLVNGPAQSDRFWQQGLAGGGPNIGVNGEGHGEGSDLIGPPWHCWARVVDGHTLPQRQPS